jgi:hypothetical protein
MWPGLLGNSRLTSEITSLKGSLKFSCPVSQPIGRLNVSLKKNRFHSLLAALM